MLDFREKKKIRSIIYSKISIVIVAVLLILVIKNVWVSYGDNKMTKLNRDLAEQELLDLKNRETEIQRDIEILNTKQGVEKEIRSKFQVAKEGEEMIMIIDTKDKGKEYLNEEKNNIWFKLMSFLGFK